MPTAPTIRGGAYRAVKQTDGTWSVLDVPIFATCRRTFQTRSGEVTLDVDRGWQEKAVERAQAKYQGGKGFLSPLWVTHETGKRRRVGFILPKKVESRRVGEHDLDTTIADYVGLSEADYADFKAGRYPYVSAEVPVKTSRDPVIDGAALLPAENPYHEFPLQTVGEEVSDPARAEGVLAFRSTDETVAVLSRFTMPDESNATPPTPATPKDEAAPAWAKAILDGINKLLGGGAANPAPAQPAPVVAAAFNKDEPGTGTTTTGTGTDSAEVVAKFTALETENKTLKDRLDARDKAEARRAAVDSAVDRLKGFDVGGDAKTLCEGKYDAGGKVALDAFVDGRVLAGDREPDEAWSRGEHQGDIDPLVAKFGKDNADMIGVLSREYEGLKAKTVSRESYVRVGLTRANRITEAAAYGPAAK